MPRVKRTLALIYAVNPFGADHMSHEHDPGYEEDGYEPRLGQIDLRDPQPERSLNAEKVRFALYTQYMYSCIDSVNVCDFVWGPGWQLYSSNQLVELAPRGDRLGGRQPVGADEAGRAAAEHAARLQRPRGAHPQRGHRSGAYL